MGKEKSFFKIGLIYTIGQVLSKAISFILLPIYTRQLGSYGYGQLALVDAVMDCISTFLIINIYSGYIRFYKEYDDKDKKLLKNTAINFSIILAIIDIIFFVIFGKSISNLVFKFDNSYKILMLVVIRSLITQFITLFMCDYSLNYDAMITVITNTIMLVMNLGLSIWLVVIKQQGILGVYRGYIYSNSIILIFLAFTNIKSYKFELDKTMLKKMFTFGVGLIPCNISGTILTMADRYFLAGYKSFNQTGIYSIGYKFGMLINPLFIDPFRSIFTPYKFDIWKNNDAQEKFNEMFKKYHVIGCFIMLFISVYSKFAIKVFTTSEYVDAYKLIPLVLLSYLLYGKSCFYNLGIQITNRTYLDGFIMLCGGVVNIILNIILIPKNGMYGAALATVLSYVIMNILYLKISLPMYHIKYNFKIIFKLYFVTLSLYGIYYLTSVLNLNIVIEFLVETILIIMYVIIIIKIKIIDKQEVYFYLNKIKYKILKKEGGEF
ncbi:hypothetical protein Z968_03000 [Clostridium novyi A str. 4552]|uniref:Uncharacterized protein n=1 Tax=Clostridium novyi A str. 4552 TaxID=1444289 RepID=A0A0A0IAC1_CLONO|nr:oligosaccharide flippase family protein [Clostridium novyi]KGM97503.1 hypothetical protein Z968_03000 [Clostridium novyi A str. 4552]